MGSTPKTVTIPLSDYEALLNTSEQFRQINARKIPPSPGKGSSAIERDPELAAFIKARLGRYRLKDIAALCRENFGTFRAPSKSSIHRYWKRLLSQ